MRCEELMNKDIQWVSPRDTVEDAASKMRDHDIGAMLVCEGGKTVGMVTDRDIAIRAFTNGKDLAAIEARHVMSGNVVFCRNNGEAEEALRIMEKNKIRRLPVLNEDGKLVGMVSLGDISHALSRERTGEVTKAVSAHHA